METYGYVRRSEAAHIERSIETRQGLLFEQRFYCGPGPKTAAMRLPWPQGTTELPLLEAASAAGDAGPGQAPRSRRRRRNERVVVIFFVSVQHAAAINAFHTVL